MKRLYTPYKVTFHNNVLFIGMLVTALLIAPFLQAGERHRHDKCGNNNFFGLNDVECVECAISSPLIACTNCNGTGINGSSTDGNCKGSGMLHQECQHAFVDETLDEIPEMNFTNPILFSGTDKTEGAVYKFTNVYAGADGLLKLKKFSHSNIVIANIDNASYGWDKAFQPEFGMNPVPANTKWFIDFELTLVKSGTNIPIKADRFTASSIDVDGDNVNVAEFINMYGTTTTSYSAVTYLQNVQSMGVLKCERCDKVSAANTCTKCVGTGIDPTDKRRRRKCETCDGVGKVYIVCSHPFEGEAVNVTGPTENFTNIDTAATQVMATYIYNNKSSINFTIGAQSGQHNNYGAGIRLNSLWFKSFSLASQIALPVKLQSFTAVNGKSTIIINWTTAHEVNFSHFVVERSMDGKKFSDIATVVSTEVYGQNSYTYKDVTATPGIITYYRLRFVDRTKESILSEIRSVRLGSTASSKLALATYPNPAIEEVKITLPNAWQGRAVTLELYNSTGIRMKSAQTNNASQTEMMQLANLSKGFYIVKATCENETAQQRMIKN